MRHDLLSGPYRATGGSSLRGVPREELELDRPVAYLCSPITQKTSFSGAEQKILPSCHGAERARGAEVPRGRACRVAQVPSVPRCRGAEVPSVPSAPRCRGAERAERAEVPSVPSAPRCRACRRAERAEGPSVPWCRACRGAERAVVPSVPRCRGAELPSCRAIAAPSESRVETNC